MEEKVLYNVLSAIKRGDSGDKEAPDRDYLVALDTVGMIRIGWNTEITSLGLMVWTRLNDMNWS